MRKKKLSNRQSQGANLTNYFMSPEETAEAITRGGRIVRKLVRALTFGTSGSGHPLVDVASAMYALAATKVLIVLSAQDAGIDATQIYEETEKYLTETLAKI